MLDLNFLGGHEYVTGSKTLMAYRGEQYLIDCGLTQGEGKNSNVLQDLPHEIHPKKLSAVFLTHAHVDHSGLLARLVRMGLNAPIYCTPATAELMIPLLEDSAKLHVAAVKELRDKNPKRKDLLPLYDLQDVDIVRNRLRLVDFEKSVRHHDLEFTFYPNAHILGSALIRFETRPTVIFSGDLGRFESLLEKKVEIKVRPADIVVMESTYGDRLHHNDAQEKLENLIMKAKKQHRVVVMASFALARTQALLIMLNRIMKANKELEMPIFLDSPLGIKMTRIYAAHKEALAPAALELSEAFGRAEELEYSSQREKLLSEKHRPPFIVIASSGMVSGGRILENLKTFGEQSQNTFVLTGFQAPGTLGARIEAGEREFIVDTFVGPESMQLLADVEVLHGLSAHADQAELLQWGQKLAHPHSEIILNHGEQNAKEGLIDAFQKVHLGKIMCTDQDHQHFKWDT